MSCGVGCRGGSDPALLWLWRGPVAVAPIGPLAWESPYAVAAALEKAKRQKKKKKKAQEAFFAHSKDIFLSLYFLSHRLLKTQDQNCPQASSPLLKITYSLIV